ncbi:GPW/gp25 family protein [Sphingomonas sp. CFBP 13714]|uniref:GPW/gp25 family protein n=1 Tax=Sphingomonas sp. CFBP 13714 TaxID=2775308 RepID=UPI0017838103|nr:GPW/gp25 family protein [Sphingomonas sp. CFBP 13714]MBD8699045.1 GPW/gp25 family protein [Sphingomonas sp. CFBP 13714]
MIGMSAVTGKPLEGLDHLRQSIADILSTPIGTRVGQREYGSLLAELVDQPMNAVGRMRLMAATALAIQRWEPRVTLSAVVIEQTGPGVFSAQLAGRRTDVTGPSASTRLTVPLPRSSPTVYA